MTAICYRCGFGKAQPLQQCTACHATPDREDDIVLSFLLTESFLDQENLVATAEAIRNGQRIEVPPALRAKVLANLHRARTQPPAVSNVPAKIGFVVLAITVAVLFFTFHPWPHWQWVSFNDKIGTYQSFILRFPDSAYTPYARDRIRLLREEERWARANKSSDIEALRFYVQVYPDGRHLDDAKQQISRIADQKWAALSGSRSVPEILDYLENYPESPVSGLAGARIQELYNDLGWVKEQDTLEHYRRFVARHPSHPETASMEKRIIDLEVKAIAAGEHVKIPQSQVLNSGGTATKILLENQTGHELTVRYSGPESQKMIIPDNTTLSISLPPGDYLVAASVNAANVMNYYGTETMQGGSYSCRFVIGSSSGGSILPNLLNPARRRK